MSPPPRPPLSGPRARSVRLALALGALLLVGVCGCASQLSSFDARSSQGVEILSLFNLALVLSALLFLLVTGLLIYVVVRFRARPGEPDPQQVEGHPWLEIVWTVTPSLLVLVLFVLVVTTMNRVEAAPTGSLEVRVIAHQWWWEYQYPDRGVVTANELHLPTGPNVQLQLESADVIHSFWVPQFGWKRDAVPGKQNVINVQLFDAGTFEGTCTEFCGTQHAWMRIRVVAAAPADFETWVQAQQQPAQPPSGDQAIRGQQVFLSNTCVTCHHVEGVGGQANVGPVLTHFGSRATLGAGVVDNTAQNLRQWISDPHQVKPGVRMPAYTSLSEADLDALVAYLEGLK